MAEPLTPQINPLAELLSSSVKERKSICDRLAVRVQKPDLKTSAIEEISELLKIGLFLYQDRKSQSYLLNVLKSLVKRHKKTAINSLTSKVSGAIVPCSNYVATSNTAKMGLFALRWLCIMLADDFKYLFNEDKPLLRKIISTQSLLLSSVTAACNSKLSNKAQRLVRAQFKNNESNVTLYMDCLLELEPTIELSLLSSAILVFASKNENFLNDYKVKLIELFIKVTINTKRRPPVYAIMESKSLIDLIDISDFEKMLLPAITKAMLRNPEIILQSVGEIISAVDFDLSQFAFDLGKGFSSYLTSKNETCRNDASYGCLKVANKCKEVQNLQRLLKHICDLYHGSEGKLALAEQKICVLQGIGNLSNTLCSDGSLQSLVDFVLNQFVKILDVELHEKTLVHALEMMNLWLEKLSPNKTFPLIVTNFQKKVVAKSSSPSINSAYIECMNTYFTEERLSQGLQISPLLLKSVEKATVQHTQVNALLEGLSATCLLLKLSTLSKLEETIKISQFWTIVLDMNKPIFLTEKFVTQCSVQATRNLIYYCSHLIHHKYEYLIGPPTPLHKTIIYCAINKSFAMRQFVAPIIAKFTESIKGPQIVLDLLAEYAKFINEMDAKFDDPSNEYNINTGKKILTEAMLLICSKTNLRPPHTQNMILNSLLPSHHPNLEFNGLWIKIMGDLKIKPNEFICNNEKKIVKMLIDEYDGTKCMENAAETIMRCQPEMLIPTIVKKSNLVLGNNSLLDITDEQYIIYHYPEGELYNKSVITESPGSETDINKNVKRESKVYSYKDQQEEILLRKELEEKKRKAGLIKVPEFSEKQKELVQKEIEKESAIRKEVQQLKDNTDKIISLIRATSRGNYISFSLRFRYILPLLIRNFQSPLVASSLCQLFVDLRHLVFLPEDAEESKQIAYLTLYYSNPKCDLEVKWTRQRIDAAMEHLVDFMLNRRIFDSPTFAYFYWLLHAIMLSNEADVRNITDCLKIISLQGEIKRWKSGKKLNLFAAKWLPRTQIFEAILKITDKIGAGILRQTADNVMVQIALTCSNEEGCDPPTTEELNALFSGLQHSNPAVRDTSMKALEVMSPAFSTAKMDNQLRLKLTKRIWIAKHDICLDNRDIAEYVWDACNFDLSINNLSDTILEDIINGNLPLQQAAAQALAALLPQLQANNIVNSVVKKLLNLYQEKLTIVKAIKDEFGHVLKEAIDLWQPRKGIALALEQLAPLVSGETITTLINFYVATGLMDRNESVQRSMLSAGCVLVNEKGKENFAKLLPIFEKFLKKTPASGEFDVARAGVIVLMATLARHLSPEDPKFKPIINKLIDALSTPSQQVQEAVAESLHPLVAMVKPDAPIILKKILNRLLNGSTYGERKGAAYGLSATIKGAGIGSIRQYYIMETLTEAIQDKKNYKRREGALFGLERLCISIGRLFEPYVINILKYLLLCFGDNSEYVRTAADECAKVVMSLLSSQGIKMILPVLLETLEEDSWRTKTGSVELLGAMAFCAPKQLSSCLPSIVPKLIEVLSDSHIKVQQAGAQALRVIGSVIRNPEVQAIVDVLLDALQDPPNKISVCMSTLLSTKFIHFIDAPSLALIMPVVQRAFMDRSTETRKMAAQIIGNMYSLTDEKDLTPYLPAIMPGLKSSLLDPAPEVRSVSARALGAMVRGMGESCFEDLLPWLMRTLTSESSPVDRSGAAQGLSEVVGGLGLDKLHHLMPEIISTSDRSDIAPHVKDGYLMMFIYMPVVFENQFTPYIGQIIVPILKALADENEYVRETALKAGQRIVTMYAESAIQLLLPELEKGLFDDNWRIRSSSVQLLGDLLYRISGVTGKMSTETANDDDNFGTEHSHKIIISSLGTERRNKVLSGLYICRSDVSLLVRQAALHVWKVVVSNTPRTLREILKTLFGLLLTCLASPNYDRRQVGARTLGDLVRKLGERVLPEIIPLLEKGLESEESAVRQGVCIGLSEIVTSTSRDMVLAFMHSLVPTVRKTLCDPLPEVRKAAAKTFDSLHTSVGVKALDDILPFMLEQLRSSDPETSDRALDGLRQVMTMKSRVVLPYLIPQLTTPPINVKALAILASVAGDSLTRYLHKILPSLLKVVSTENGKCEMEHCQTVILAVTDEIGIRVIMDQLQEATRSDNKITRTSAIYLLSSFCKNTKADYKQYVPQLIRIFIHLMTDQDPEILQPSWDALNSIVRSLESQEQASLINEVRQAMRQAAHEIEGPEKLLPGFGLRKGIIPLLPIFREAMMNGTTDVKEQGALGLGEAIKLSSKESLIANTVLITGPMIRVIGERFEGNVKAAIIETLAILLDKVGLALKQFLPQLQTTFLKSLTDPHRNVRIKGAFALSRLIRVHGKADPLFTDIYAALKSTDDPSIKETILHTLRLVLIPAGEHMSDEVRRPIYMCLREMLGNSEDTVRATAAASLACIMRYLSPEQLHVILTEHVLVDDPSLDIVLRHGRSTALFVALKENPGYIYKKGYCEKINRTLVGYMQSDKIQIVTNGIKGCGYLFLHLTQSKHPISSTVLTAFSRCINHPNNDIKQLMAKVCMFIAKTEQNLAPEFLKSVVPALVNGTKEKNTYVKVNCELTLIAVLQLREGDATQQMCLDLLDVGARESLSDVINKVLKRLANSHHVNDKTEELDDTLLS